MASTVHCPKVKHIAGPNGVGDVGLVVHLDIDAEALGILTQGSLGGVQGDIGIGSLALTLPFDELAYLGNCSGRQGNSGI